jgi:hypothetical protein
MHENELNRRRREIETLLHAADDMIEAEVAASWWPEIENPFRRQVVITGMVVAYGRVFSNGEYTLDRRESEPTDPRMVELHESLIWWRNKFYAHTDKEGGRSASIIAGPLGIPAFTWQRGDFPVGKSAEALALFRSQRVRFQAEAERLQRALDDELAAPSA